MLFDRAHMRVYNQPMSNKSKKIVISIVAGVMAAVTLVGIILAFAL